MTAACLAATPCVWAGTDWLGLRTVGCATGVMLVAAPPSASFDFAPTNPGIEEEVSFDAARSDDPEDAALQYRWDFGDGTDTQFAAETVATHSYNAPGRYTVRLFVRDAENFLTQTTRDIVVTRTLSDTDPVAIIATGPGIGVEGVPMLFDGRLSYDLDGGAIAYVWNITQDGSLIDSLSGATATKVFNDAGTYTIELRVSDGAGGPVSTDSVEIEVVEPGSALEPPPSNPRPPPITEPEDSANQRPNPIGVCGLGMLPAMVGILTGLFVTLVARRRKG